MKRHIRLTYLIPEFLPLVDKGVVPLFAGMDISYLDEANQRLLYAFVGKERIAALDTRKSAAVKQSYKQSRMPFTLQVMQKLFRQPEPRPLVINRHQLGACAETLSDDQTTRRLFAAL